MNDDFDDFDGIDGIDGIDAGIIIHLKIGAIRGAPPGLPPYSVVTIQR